MFRFFSIIALSSLLALSCFAQDKNNNENNKIPSLDEINADLKAKKKELEPFDPSKVKVDLESLGLDDLSKKPNNDDKILEAVIPEKNGPTVIIEEKPLVKKESINKEELLPKLPQLKKSEVEVKKPTKKIAKKPVEEKFPTAPAAKAVSDEEEEAANNLEKTGIFSRIKNILRKQDEEDSKKEKLPIKDFANQLSKEEKAAVLAEEKRLKEEAKLEKIKKWNEAQEKKRLMKLKILRDKYLRDLTLDESQNYYENYLLSSESIVPKRKTLGKFIKEEAPAIPIVKNYRTQDNLHIPLIPTPQGRLDLLFSTIASGDVSSFNEIYNYIRNPNARNKFGDTILIYAILLKKYPIISSILAKGANPNLVNKLGYTPLNVALEMRDFKALELLANNKANLKYIDAFGRNYLMHAARVGSLAAVDLFIKSGINVNIMDNDGFTALAISYKHGQNVIASYLLKYGAKTWVRKSYNPEERSLIKELEDSWK